MKYLKLIYNIIAFLLVMQNAFAQEVRDIRISQEDSIVSIQYNLSGDVERFKIDLFYSNDDGKTWVGPLEGVSGDVGKRVKPGDNKKIIWNVLTRPELENGYMQFKIVAESNLFLASSNVAYTQNLDDVLAKHFETVGQEKLLEKQTYSVKATIQQMGMELPMVMKMKRPNKFRMEMEMQGQKMIQAYDGEKGWMIAPWISQEPQDLSGAELDQAMEQANIDGELYNYKEKGTTATLLGKVNVDGSPMFNIKLTDKKGNVKNYFIDAESYLVKRVKAKVNTQGQEVEVEQNMSDYKNIDGILMPMKIESKMPMGTANILFESIVFGENFDDSIFAKP